MKELESHDDDMVNLHNDSGVTGVLAKHENNLKKMEIMVVFFLRESKKMSLVFIRNYFEFIVFLLLFVERRRIS
jgi:hypothetical protein